MTKMLEADASGIARAAALLRGGELVAFGTETVYGLGADATNDGAVAAIFAAKQRPRFNPLICHYPDAEIAFADVTANERARRLAAAFWPGPLTLVLPRAESCPVSLLAGAGLDTLAVRVPAHEVARAVLRECGRPVAAPSANRSGKVSPTTAWHVLQELSGRIAAVLDSGPCAVGVEFDRARSVRRRSGVAAARRHDDRGDRSGDRPGAPRAIIRCAAIAGHARVALCADAAVAA